MDRYPLRDLLNLGHEGVALLDGARTEVELKDVRPVNISESPSPQSSPAMTMSSAAVLPADTLPQPLQFKGEIMDFDLAGLEVDHRKR